MKLSSAMIAMLANANQGLPLKHRLYGRSAHGGAEWTIQALKKRGLLDSDHKITDEGICALIKQRRAP